MQAPTIQHSQSVPPLLCPLLSRSKGKAGDGNTSECWAAQWDTHQLWAGPAQTPWACPHQLPGLRPPRREGGKERGHVQVFAIWRRCAGGCFASWVLPLFSWLLVLVLCPDPWVSAAAGDQACPQISHLQGVCGQRGPHLPVSEAAAQCQAFLLLVPNAAPIRLFALGSPGCGGPFTCVPRGTQGQRGSLTLWGCRWD